MIAGAKFLVFLLFPTLAFAAPKDGKDGAKGNTDDKSKKPKTEERAPTDEEIIKQLELLENMELLEELGLLEDFSDLENSPFISKGRER